VSWKVNIPSIPGLASRNFMRASTLKMMMTWAAVLIACMSTSVQADPEQHAVRDRSIAITIDDLPVATASRFTMAQKQLITDRLLHTLTSRKIPAIGFVNERQLFEGGQLEPEEVAFLEQWLDAGMDLGNHGYAHLSLNQTDVAVWLADAERGDQVTSELLQSRGAQIQWFRHPFLHVGRTPEIQRQATASLARRGYRIAPVSVDNSDWIYADAYAWAWLDNDQKRMRRLGEDYIRYMLEVVEYYENQSLKIIGESIPHTLLLHANALNADWLDELLDSLSQRGYQFVDLDTATQHAAYDRPIHGYTGPGGITWLHRWAITDDMDRSIFRGEPTVPDWVENLRDQRD